MGDGEEGRAFALALGGGRVAAERARAVTADSQSSHAANESAWRDGIGGEIGASSCRHGQKNVIELDHRPRIDW